MPDQRWDTGVDYDDGYGGRGGGGRARSALRRVFGDGENPLAWGLPLYRAWGIGVKVHILFLVYIAAELIHAALPSQTGFEWVAWMMGSLFVLVLLHEYGHCVACRRVGGEADEIMLWPLGGLASCRPPHEWRADLVTTLGGPAVNVVLIPVLGGAVWAATGDLASVVFNPFDPGFVIGGLFVRGGGTQPTWLIGLWSLHYANLVLAAFNLLVPMFPMDAGRIVQAIVWRRAGYRRSMEVATLVGLVAAGVLAVIGLVSGQVVLLGLAAFGGIVCYTERRRLRFIAEGGLPEDGLEPEPIEPQPSRSELKREEKAEADSAEVDRVLAKISDGGMESLTAGERRTLKRATKKSRETGE